MNTSASVPIEDLMDLAADGDRQAATTFLQRFLSDTIFVPNRKQGVALSDQPEYPNDLIYILGIQDGQRAVVPVFTQSELIEDWTGSKLEHLSMTGARLITLIPDEWWVCLNPGSDLQKEFSPWEVEQLKGGEANFPAIIEEQYALESQSDLSVEPLKEGEDTKLVAALTTTASEIPEIVSLYALNESRLESNISTILVGALVSCSDVARRTEIQIRLRDIANLAQIGDRAVRVVVADKLDGGLELGIFKVTKPFFERSTTTKSSIFSRLARRLGARHR